MRLGWLFATTVLSTPFLLRGEPVAVRQPQGVLHGFLALRGQNGGVLASGELMQSVKGAQVTSVLRFQFKDGSLHEETSVFTQRKTFRLVAYRQVQKGPAFKRPTDMQVNAKGQVTIRYTDDDGKEKTIEERMELPADLANGLIPILVTNVDPKAEKTTVSMLASTPKPRLVKVEISPNVGDSFSVMGATKKAQRYVAKIEIGGISGVIAPLVGKQPPDTHLWVVGGAAPGFLKSEGPLCQDCPIWRIELASPAWGGGKAGASE
ncbi:MAG: hypothetical protein JNK87_36870 [Bryobacterales bacterium]|nr:hypothetical protein [Bryobacterales bacterium]